MLLVSAASFCGRAILMPSAPDISSISAFHSIEAAKLRDPDPDVDAIWAPFDFDTTYFGSNKQQAMVNFRVDDLAALHSDLVAGGVEIVPERSEDAAGRFA